MIEDRRTPVDADRSGRLLDTLLIGLPDAVTAGWCLFVWIHPLALGADTVKSVVLMILMEFILLNATGFFTAIPFMLDLSRGVRSAMLLGLCAIYTALILAFALPFHALWPFFAFGWLAVSKLAWVIRNRRVSGDEQLWLMGAWAFSVVAYLGAVGAGVMLAVPQFGITADVLPSLNLPHGGEWVDTPHKAVASATIYFAALALFKWMCAILRKFYPDRRRRQQPAILGNGFGDP
jgi:hypothetical protein